jgi:hypothetical protein
MQSSPLDTEPSMIRYRRRAVKASAAREAVIGLRGGDG